MADRYADLRAALDAVPCVKWTASRSTVHIPETEDWAGKGLSITGLDKQVARKLARYIADTNPVVIRALLAEMDALIHDNSEYVSAANELATENQRLREALTEMIDVAERVDGWASFPQEAMGRARAALAQEQGGSDGDH